MRGPVIVVCVLFLMIQALAVGFGFTVAPRILFPLHDPYEGDDDIERGVMAGFSFSFDIGLLPGLSVGPYFSGLFSTDTDPPEGGDLKVRYIWSDLVVGVNIRFTLPTGGLLRPWLGVTTGYGILGLVTKVELPWGTYETDYDNTGGFGLDAGIGVDYRISEVFTVGFGLEFHLNTADKVKREVDGETWDFELDESPVGLGFGMDVGVSF